MGDTPSSVPNYEPPKMDRPVPAGQNTNDAINNLDVRRTGDNIQEGTDKVQKPTLESARNAIAIIDSYMTDMKTRNPELAAKLSKSDEYMAKFTDKLIDAVVAKLGASEAERTSIAQLIKDIFAGKVDRFTGEPNSKAPELPEMPKSPTLAEFEAQQRAEGIAVTQEEFHAQQKAYGGKKVAPELSADMQESLSGLHATLDTICKKGINIKGHPELVPGNKAMILESLQHKAANIVYHAVSKEVGAEKMVNQDFSEIDQWAKDSIGNISNEEIKKGFLLVIPPNVKDKIYSKISKLKL